MTPQTPWKKWDRVFARWAGDGCYYSGTITAAGPTFVDVRFDDNLTGRVSFQEVHPFHLSPGQHVQGCKAGSALYFPAEVERLEAGKVHLRFLDGHQEAVAPAQVRLLSFQVAGIFGGPKAPQESWQDIFMVPNPSQARSASGASPFPRSVPPHPDMVERVVLFLCIGCLIYFLLVFNYVQITVTVTAATLGLIGAPYLLHRKRRRTAAGLAVLMAAAAGGAYWYLPTTAGQSLHQAGMAAQRLSARYEAADLHTWDQFQALEAERKKLLKDFPGKKDMIEPGRQTWGVKKLGQVLDDLDPGQPFLPENERHARQELDRLGIVFFSLKEDIQKRKEEWARKNLETLQAALEGLPPEQFEEFAATASWQNALAALQPDLATEFPGLRQHWLTRSGQAAQAQLEKTGPKDLIRFKADQAWRDFLRREAPSLAADLLKTEKAWQRRAAQSLAQSLDRAGAADLENFFKENADRKWLADQDLESKPLLDRAEADWGARAAQDLVARLESIPLLNLDQWEAALVRKGPLLKLFPGQAALLDEAAKSWGTRTRLALQADLEKLAPLDYSGYRKGASPRDQFKKAFPDLAADLVQTEEAWGERTLHQAAHGLDTLPPSKALPLLRELDTDLKACSPLPKTSARLFQMRKDLVLAWLTQARKTSQRLIASGDLAGLEKHVLAFVADVSPEARDAGLTAPVEEFQDACLFLVEFATRGKKSP